MDHSNAAVRQQKSETVPPSGGLGSEEKEETKLGKDAESKLLGPQPETNNNLNRALLGIDFGVTFVSRVHGLSKGVTDSPLQMWSPPKQRFSLEKRWNDCRSNFHLGTTALSASHW